MVNMVFTFISDMCIIPLECFEALGDISHYCLVNTESLIRIHTHTHTHTHMHE